MAWWERIRRQYRKNVERRLEFLDLQAKVILVLIGVTIPTFILITTAQNQLARPLIVDELRQIAINTGKSLSAEVVASRLFSLPNPTPALENRIQEYLFTQPNILRLEIFERDQNSGQLKSIASSVEIEPGEAPSISVVPISILSELKEEEGGQEYWEVIVPIETRGIKSPRKVLGAVYVTLSLSLVDKFVATLWKSTVPAAFFSVVALVVALSYFLRKTIANDRKLRQAETRNLALTEQLHEVRRDLLNNEKFAVMGQLTASFAHEIGTPLNAMGGHLHLLKEELRDEAVLRRLEIIQGQVSKIESIVKSFLQSTSKPASQKQLVDVHSMINRTLAVVAPRIGTLDVELIRDFDPQFPPLRLVPLDLEQMILNLVTNSLDSIEAKTVKAGHSRVARGQLRIHTHLESMGDRTWGEIEIYDTGEGIKKSELGQVMKPFYTTKAPGVGTGLGLPISKELVSRYGGVLEIESKEGAWTSVKIRIPGGDGTNERVA